MAKVVLWRVVEGERRVSNESTGSCVSKVSLGEIWCEEVAGLIHALADRRDSRTAGKSRGDVREAEGAWQKAAACYGDVGVSLGQEFEYAVGPHNEIIHELLGSELVVYWQLTE